MLSAAFVAMTSAVAHAETIGVAMSLFDDNWLTGLRHSMEDHAKGLKDVTVNTEDGQGDIAKQQSQVDNFIAAGVDGIVIMLVDADAGAAISKRAAEAGIPLVFVNNAPSNVDSLPDKQAFVGSNEEQAGTLETETVCKMLGGKGKAVIIQGQLGTTGQRGRTKATHDVLATDACKGIEVVDEQSANWMRTPSLDLVTNWLSAGRDFDAVIANNDEMALGAIQALKASGKSMDKVVVGGVDATADALAAMQAGDLDVTVFQNAKGQGVGAIDTVLKLARGEKVEKKTYIPFELVTKDNLAQYTAKN
ncbi:sugar ABC transporter substrate-binding protein (plasmid) [Rhizobium grahamii]|uniref:Sugar ABC transporter substrate-binding protein n=2 Tax=Rhizobium TaxID=379 RepID=A0A5Q0CHZ3_9HYPH|nr:sugar ABC transporter substrate-binding protein [Rhizobium grahamii]QRM53018.1 sugar ABC transporter substrate-binding protein [Rhizobium sp. BG6]